ncbi:hypothetical protein Cni_G25120 [Canna indica]|uniref:Uncharacterized protein n=1 Tax=Canna indica TaxID=4628 RepID=A0AAQ3QNX9_9LILI|nr:hypothetical protein Cni_G25120 [Canna indica]
MDAKKKRNKKKKGNQQKVTEDATSNSEKVTVQESNNGPVLEENHNTHNPTNADIQSVGVSESDIEHDKHKVNEDSFATLQEEVGQLKNERTLWLQKQVDLEEKIKLLQEEISSCVQREATLEGKIRHFEIQNDRLVQEAAVEEKLKNVESIKESLILNMNSLEERIAGVEEGTIALDMQVKELGGSTNIYFEENHRIVEKVEGLELRIQSLEERATSHENLTEKMNKTNEPYPEHAKHVEQSSGTELNLAQTHDKTSSPSHHVSELSKKTTESSEIVQSLESQEKHVANGGINEVFSDTVERSGLPQPLDEPRLSEAATVPFDEIQIHEDDIKVMKDDNVPEQTPFSDAPLIGAPFRLISFMAKYVSGADLVQQNSSRSGQ